MVGFNLRRHVCAIIISRFADISRDDHLTCPWVKHIVTLISPQMLCHWVWLLEKNYTKCIYCNAYNWAATWAFQQCGMCDQQSLRSACVYAQSDQSLCKSLEYFISVQQLTEQHLEFLSLKGAAKVRLSLHLSKCHIVGNYMPRLICHLCLVLRRLPFFIAKHSTPPWSTLNDQRHFILCLDRTPYFLGLEVLFRSFSISNYREVDKIILSQKWFFSVLSPTKHIVCLRKRNVFKRHKLVFIVSYWNSS